VKHILVWFCITQLGLAVLVSDLSLLQRTLDKIEMKESDGIMTTVGRHGEVSSYQIMVSTIRCYNKFHKTKYTVAQVKKSRPLARKIAFWALTWYSDRYLCKDPDLTLVRAVSGYNTGHGMGDKGIIRYDYVVDVVPEALARCIKRYGMNHKRPKNPDTEFYFQFKRKP
jgi:hypothetical protein